MLLPRNTTGVICFDPNVQLETWEHILKSQENIYSQNPKWDMELPVAATASPDPTKLI